MVNAVQSKHVFLANCHHTIHIISTPLKCQESAHITMCKNTKTEIERKGERLRGRGAVER